MSNINHVSEAQGQYVLIKPHLKKHVPCIWGKSLLVFHYFCDAHRVGKEVDAQNSDTKCGSLKENGPHKEQYY